MLRSPFLIALAVILVFGFVACSRNSTNRATTRENLLKRAEAVLENISRNPENAIPDAVLNHTQCVLVFPSTRGDAGIDGVVSCREADQAWNKPVAVTLQGRHTPKESDLVVFVLSSSASRAVHGGNFDLGSTTPGPLVRVSSVIAPVELRSDAVAYVRHDAQLKGSALPGRVRAENDQQWSVQQAEPYKAALVSFFNLIVPTGIIIHHTATIPGEGKVPGTAQEVDQYHQERGFGVLCQGKEYHVAYHYLVLPDGKIQQGRPERCEGAHAPGYNSYLGISVAGDFSSTDNPRGAKGPERPSAAQLKALIDLCRKLRQRYNIPVQHILRHSDVAPTKCPGDNFPFRYVVSQVAGPG